MKKIKSTEIGDGLDALLELPAADMKALAMGSKFLFAPQVSTHKKNPIESLAGLPSPKMTKI